ncbi:MAG: ABC transporter permease [Bacteroidetes bacterium]|nr:MAG: ABC transporter permease [Bacteroidota bacterium]
MLILKMAWRNLWRNRRRTLITTTAVFFAVLLSTLMSSIQLGMYEKMIDNVVGFYSGYVQVHQAGYWDDQVLDNSFEATPDLREQVLATRFVTEAVPRLESFALAASDEKSLAAQVIGCDPEIENRLTQLQEKLVAGTYLGPGDQGLLVAQGLAENLKVGLHDTLVLLSQGYHGATAVGKYPIQGLLKFGSPELNNNLIYLTLPEAQYLYGAPARLTSLALVLDQGTQAPRVVKALQTELDTAAFEVMDWRGMMPELVQMMEADVGASYVYLLILYLVIGFGIFGTVLMMTQERRFEFGVMIAVGMKRLKLAAMVVLELLFINGIGVLAGIGATIPVAAWLKANPIDLSGGEMADMYADYGFEALMPASLDPTVFINQASIVFVITLLISLYPFFKITRMDAVESMRG